jgi:hypothetical protein
LPRLARRGEKPESSQASAVPQLKEREGYLLMKLGSKPSGTNQDPYAPSFVWQSAKIALREAQFSQLIALCGCGNLADAKVAEFRTWLTHVLGSYQSYKGQLRLRQQARIRRRLEHLQSTSLYLLTGFKKWEQAQKQKFGAASGLTRGLMNLDEITKRLLVNDYGADVVALKSGLLKEPVRNFVCEAYHVV